MGILVAINHGQEGLVQSSLALGWESTRNVTKLEGLDPDVVSGQGLGRTLGGAGK